MPLKLFDIQAEVFFSELKSLQNKSTRLQKHTQKNTQEYTQIRKKDTEIDTETDRGRQRKTNKLQLSPALPSQLMVQARERVAKLVQRLIPRGVNLSI